MMVAGILGWAAIIWYILARKNPKKFAPFLKAPYGNKRGYIFIVLFLVTGFIGMAIGPAPNTISTTQHDTQHIQKKSPIQNELIASPEEEGSILSTLNSVGINSVKSLNVDANLVIPDDQTIKGYYLIDDSNRKIVIYFTPEKTVYRIVFNGSVLYENGNIVQKIQDCTFKGNEESTLRQIAEKITKKHLKSPSTAKFPSMSEYSFSKDKGIATVKGFVDSQNSFGAMIRTNFIMTYDVKNDKLVNYQVH
jgi:hypothetical protein